MGVPTFPVPSNITKIVDLLNAKGWNLVVHQRDEAIFIVDGDQVQFTATTEAEVKDFLFGLFLATYEGVAPPNT